MTLVIPQTGYHLYSYEVYDINTYRVLDLAIQSTSTAYLAQVISSPAGEARHEFTLPFSKNELPALKTWRVDATWPFPQLSPQEVGERLYQAIFGGAVGEALRRSQDAARRDQQILHIRLRLDGAPELATLPWELLYETQRGSFLALSEHTPLVRYLSLPIPAYPIDVPPPLHLLVATASPADMPALDVEAEWGAIQKGLDPLVDRGLIQVEHLPQASWEGIQQRLRKGDVHILHFVGHGAFDEEAGEGGLVLVGENEQPTWVEAARFGALIADHRTLRLVILNACQGATSTAGNILAGVAQTLVRQGIPAVVAMQHPLADKHGVAFAREFYAAIADGRPVDAALSEGRKAIYQTDSVAWATPVLFMRTPDGQLFRQPVIEKKAEDAEQKPEDKGQPTHTGHQPAANRRMALFLIGTLSSLLGNVIAGLINLNQVWSIVAIVFLWLLLVGVELWLTRAEAHGAPLPIPKVWVEPKVLVRAGALLLVILVGAISIPRLLPPLPACPPGKQCVLVARFTPETNLKAQEITDHLANEIRRVLTAAAGEDIALAIGEPVTNEEEARALAEREGALLVVWGTVRESEGLTMVHLQMVDLLGITESKSVRPYRAEPMLYDPVAGRFQCKTCMDIEDAATRQVSMVAYVAVGLTHYASGQPEAAQANFSAALHCAGEALDADIILISQSVCAPGEPIGSRRPGLIYYYLGKSLILEGSYRRGIEMLKQAANVNPYDPAAWIGIGSALQSWSAQHDLPEAVKAFAQAKRLLESPRLQSAPLRHFHLGLIHELQRDYPAAVAAYESARQRTGAVAPDSYNILIALGRAQRLAGESDAAAVTLERAIELVPDSPWAYLELALVHGRDHAAALSWIEKAKQSDPRQAYIFIVQSELCQRWDDWPCALESIEKALALRHGSGWILNQLGYLHLPQNPVKSGQDWNHALSYLELAAEARRDDPWVHDQLAYVYSNVGRNEEASRHYQSAIQFAYSDNVAARSYCNLASTYVQSKNPDAARANYQTCADLATDVDLRNWAEQRIAELINVSE
jgi:tetratricopeptide (TPR) repeat protein